MALNPPNGSAQRRGNPFVRAESSSPSPAPFNSSRPKSSLFSSPTPTGASTPASHGRSRSRNSFGAVPNAPGSAVRHHRTDSRNGTPTSSTFAPSFIKSDEMRRENHIVNGIEGENDFSGKRYVWLKDPQDAFVKGWVVEELGSHRILVQTDDGTVSFKYSDFTVYWLTRSIATRA